MTGAIAIIIVEIFILVSLLSLVMNAENRDKSK